MKPVVILLFCLTIFYGCFEVDCPDGEKRSRREIETELMNAFVFDKYDTLKFTFNTLDTVVFVSTGRYESYLDDCEDFHPDCGCLSVREVQSVSKSYVSAIYRGAFYGSIAADYSSRIHFGITDQYDVWLNQLEKATDTIMVNGIVYSNVVKNPKYAFNKEKGVLFLISGNDKWERLE